MKLPLDIDAVKGFLAHEEGEALFETAKSVAHLGPLLEVGSYCGKSTVYLGQAAKECGTILFAVDHHRGSEEHQLGEEYHDPALYDSDVGKMDSFRMFRHTMDTAGLLDAVVPIVSSSAVAASKWATPLAMVFVDGGHSLEAATTDYESWSRHIVDGGVLAIHDLFPDPDTGGQAPITIYRRALESGLFDEVSVVRTLGLLRRNDR